MISITEVSVGEDFYNREVVGNHFLSAGTVGNDSYNRVSLGYGFYSSGSGEKRFAHHS